MSELNDKTMDCMGTRSTNTTYMLTEYSFFWSDV